MQVYIVKKQDTLKSIADKMGVSPFRIVYDNEILNNKIVEGEALLILYPKEIYQIKEGDSLYSIADKYNTTVKQLLRNNSYLLNEDFLVPGRQIVIQYERKEERNINVFGYAYGFIKNYILEESELYIDEILPFPYGFNEDGTLIKMKDIKILESANKFQIDKRMVITPLSQSGLFNNQLIVQLLSDEIMQNILIENIVLEMKEKGYQALDIDFEFIPIDVKDDYVLFIEKTKNQLIKEGYLVSVAVPPKISDEQKGILYEGIDYKGIGEVADSIFLMTYEWGYKYGPPMAIAPIPNVRKVLEYAVSRIPREKLDLGIPNYAYDWPLPYTKGKTVAETIGNREAIQRGILYGGKVEYDEISKAPFINYEKDGIKHVIWFEDVRSIIEKYNLIKEYDLRGAGYWNLMREFRQNWMYVNQII